MLLSVSITLYKGITMIIYCCVCGKQAVNRETSIFDEYVTTLIGALNRMNVFVGIVQRIWMKMVYSQKK